MHHYIIYAAAWLFMAGFVQQKSQDDSVFGMVLALTTGPFFFSWALGQALCRFLTKK